MSRRGARRDGPGAAGRTLLLLLPLALAACEARRRDAAQAGLPDARLRVAEAAEAAGRPEAALPLYSAVAQARPDDRTVQARYARALARSGSIEQAELVLAQAFARFPRDPVLLGARGAVRLAAGQPEEALADYEAVLMANWSDISALNGRGVALDLIGRRAEAQASYANARRLAPGDQRVANNLAMSFLLDGRAAEAAAMLRGFARRPDAPPRLVTTYALALAATGEMAAARQLLSDAVPSEALSELLHDLRAIESLGTTGPLHAEAGVFTTQAATR